jgi:predicted AlkP superfamily phosphohydrolase/phosphomutase
VARSGGALGGRGKAGAAAGMSSSRRLAMIGLDAADLDFIRSSSATLPNLSRVLAGGALHRLRSPADLLPGSVWPTF